MAYSPLREIQTLLPLAQERTGKALQPVFSNPSEQPRTICLESILVSLIIPGLTLRVKFFFFYVRAYSTSPVFSVKYAKHTLQISLLFHKKKKCLDFFSLQNCQIVEYKLKKIILLFESYTVSLICNQASTYLLFIVIVRIESSQLSKYSYYLIKS